MRLLEMNMLKTRSSLLHGLTLSAITIAGMSFAMSSYALTPFEATYQFTYGNKNMGDATRKLSLNGQTWQYKFTAKIPLIGSATETSTFALNNGQIQSQSYRRQTKILVHNDTVKLDFKAAQKQILTSRKGTDRVLTWQPHVLDDLNAELQIREDLKAGGLKSSYLIADYKEVEQRQFVKEGTETIKAADGKTYTTVKVRLKHDNATKSTIFWLAPSLDYLPIKVTHHDKDSSYGLLLKLRK